MQKANRNFWLGMLVLIAAGPAGGAPSDEAERALREDLARISTLENDRSLGGSRLADYAKDERVAVRVAAVRALGRLQTPAAGPPLVAGLDDAEAAVRLDAAFALGQLPEAGTGALAGRLAKEEDAGVRQVLIEAIGKQTGASDGAALVDLAAAGKPAPERARALYALGVAVKRAKGQLGGLSAEALVGFLKDGDADVKRAAAYVARQASELAGEGTQAATLACAGDADETTRAWCTAALANHGTAALPALEKATEDASWRVRAQAFAALGKLQAGEALAGAIRQLAAKAAAEGLALDGPDLHPVLAALDAALALPPDKAVVAAGRRLYDALREKKGLSAGHVLCRAGALGDRATGKLDLARRCGGKDYPAAYREPLQVKVVAELGTAKEKVKALRSIYSGGTPPGRAAVVAAIGEDKSLATDEAAAALVLEAVVENDPSVVAEAAAVAAKLGLKAAGRPLIRTYKKFMTTKDYETVIAVFEALGALKEPAAAEVLEEHVFHGNLLVARAATAAMKAIKGADARFAARLPSPPPMPGAPSRALADPSKYRGATLKTSKGDIKLKLLADDATRTVKHFVNLVEKGFYDGLTFHRVVPDFVAQGGDPRGDGWGGPGYTIRCEINPMRFERGVVGMALSGKDTGGSQFFITHSPQPHLDGGYTVFAIVEGGMEVVDALTIGDRIVGIELSRKP